MKEVVRRLGFLYKLNPYQMWREQSPRQIFELLNSFKQMNEDSKEVTEEKKYTVKSKNVKIPEWLKDRIPAGTSVYHADDIEKVIQGGV